jgi:hypothetical protein
MKRRSTNIQRIERLSALRTYPYRGGFEIVRGESLHMRWLQNTEGFNGLGLFDWRIPLCLDVELNPSGGRPWIFPFTGRPSTRIKNYDDEPDLFPFDLL